MKKRFFILFVFLLLGAGCTKLETPSSANSESSWKTYETETYAISYPENFIVTPMTDSIRWTTIASEKTSSEKGSIEIWSQKDLPERPLGYGDTTGTVLFPVFEGSVGIGQENGQRVRVWNYSGGPEVTKVLMEILATMEIK